MNRETPRWRLGVGVVATLGFALCVVPLTSCGTSVGWIWDCEDDMAPDFAPDGTPNPCPCRGVCMPLPSQTFWKPKPVSMWYGDVSQASMSMVDCPSNARTKTLLYAEPISVNTCPLCTCGDPTCVLPEGMSASSGTDNCMGPVYTSFAAEPTGSCSDNMMKPIQANASKSLALFAPKVSPCTPKIDIAKGATATWRKIAIVCDGVAHGPCPNHQPVCVPDAAPGFMHCIESSTLGREDLYCPDDYPNKILVYEQIDWKIACSDCACDPPVGSVCTAKVSVYTDPSCIPVSEFQSNTVPLGAPQCMTVPPNYAVAGMTDEWVTNNPGKCLPSPNGGQPTGNIDVDHATAHEFCCRPTPGDGGP